MTEDEKPRGRPAAGARLSRLVALMMAAMVLLGVALFGLGLLRRSHADHSVPSNTDMSTPSVQSLLVKGDFKRQKLTDDQLDTLKGMYYAQDPADHGALKILFDKGEKIITREQLPDKTRVIPPGGMITMDYVEDRLNVHLDNTSHIAKAKYG